MTKTARIQSEPTSLHLTDVSDATAVAVASLHAMASGTLADFHTLYTADAVNREAQTEPPTQSRQGAL